MFKNHNSVGSNVDYFITVKQQLTTHNHINIFIELVSYEKSVTFYLVTMEVINYTRLRENKRKKNKPSQTCNRKLLKSILFQLNKQMAAICIVHLKV